MVQEDYNSALYTKLRFKIYYANNKNSKKKSSRSRLEHPAKDSNMLQSVCDNLNMTSRLVILNVQALV